MFLLLAAGAARAEGTSGHNGLSTYAIAMHGQPALPADFSRLPYADPQATKGGHLALAYQGTFDSLNPYNLSAGSTAQGLIGHVFQSLMLRASDGLLSSPADRRREGARNRRAAQAGHA